ncbi:MAG: hypothetical protein ACI8ZB_004030 [Desulforhopalus sp.]|jgi:hypothetical protein
MKLNRICLYLLITLFFSINVFAGDDKQLLDLVNGLFQSEPVRCSNNDKCYCLEFKSKSNVPLRFFKSQFCKKQIPSEKHTVSFVSWDKEGNKVDEGDYSINGKMIGNWVSWHPNGVKASEGLYSDGKPVGVYRSWHKNGKLASQGQYKDGNISG